MNEEKSPREHVQAQKPIMKFVAVLVFIIAVNLSSGNSVLAEQGVFSRTEQPSIQVVVQVSTWKTRGRLLYDIEGSILKKLSLAGFQAIHDSTKPHQYQLVVQYEEERGAQYGVKLWGTTIDVSFLFRGAGIGEPLSWTIRETSTNVVSGTAPYLDALLKLETHPHYFFLGPMLQKITQGENLQADALTQAVIDFVQVVYPTLNEAASQDSPRIQDHFMDNSQHVYQEVALQRVLDELVNQDIQDDQLTPIAERLLESVDPHSRVRAVQILGRTQNAAFHEKIKKLAASDPILAVRQAAQQFAPL